MARFTVYGQAVAKQSFRYVRGGGYTPASVLGWEHAVRVEARQFDMMHGDIEVSIEFFLKDRHRKDLDNLSKAILDSIKHVLFDDDSQVVKLTLSKSVDREVPRVVIDVKEASNG